MTAPTLHLADVYYRTSDRFDLLIPDLSITPGITVVVGANGSGKSTLLRLLATAIAPTSGRYTVAGIAADPGSRLVSIRRMLGYLPQEDSTPPRLRVFDHVDLIAIAREIDPNQRARRRSVGNTLVEADLSDLANERCGHLSGGQRRRVAVAAALVGDAKILVLDEPDTGVDDDHKLQLAQALRRRAHTATIVVATHDTQWAAQIADRQLQLHDGRLAVRPTI